MEKLAHGAKQAELDEVISEQICSKFLSDWCEQSWIKEIAETCIAIATAEEAKNAERLLSPQAAPQAENLLPPTDYVTESFTPFIHSPAAYTPLESVESRRSLESIATSEFADKTYEFLSANYFETHSGYRFDFIPMDMSEREARSALKQYAGQIPGTIYRGFIHGDQLVDYSHYGKNPCFFWAVESTTRMIAGAFVYNYEAKAKWINIYHLTCISSDAY